MFRAQITRNIAFLLIGLLIFTQAVYADSESGMVGGIRWYVSVHSLELDYDETYSTHTYKIGLYKDMEHSVYGVYEFAHFVHDRTLGTTPRESKTERQGKSIKKDNEVDRKTQTIGTYVDGLPTDHDYEIEAYTRLEIYKGGKRVKPPKDDDDGEIKATEFKKIDI